MPFLREKWEQVAMNFGKSKTSLRKRASSLQNTSKLEAGRRHERARTGSSISPLQEGFELRKPSRLALYKYVKRALLGFLILLSLSGFIRLWLTRDPCRVMESSRRSLAKSIERKNFKPDVPKIIHQQWKNTTVPAMFKAWQEKWKKLFPEPEFKYILWTDESGKKLIEEHYPFFIDTYNSYEFGIQRADSMRYFILHHFGGVYADLDYEPMTNFWDYIPKDRVGLVESPYQYVEVVQNSLMTSPAKDPFWFSVFEALETFKKKPVFSSTGPSLLVYAFSNNDEPYYTLPCENFYRIPHGEYDRSPFWGVLQRETIGRLFPMKYCGEFAQPECQLARHHCSASYIKDTGVLALLWNGENVLLNSYGGL